MAYRRFPLMGVISQAFPPNFLSRPCGELFWFSIFIGLEIHDENVLKADKGVFVFDDVNVLCTPGLIGARRDVAFGKT